MKAKVKAAVTAKSNDKAKTVVKVSATVQAAVHACFDASAKVSIAQRALETQWETCGKLLSKEYPDKETAAEVLKAAFTAEGKDGVKYSRDRSCILTFAFPKKPERLAQAKADKLPVYEALKAARGKIKRTKEGKWVPVEGSAGNTGGGAGGNRIPPLQTLQKNLALCLTQAMTGKLTAEQVGVAIAENLKAAKYSIDDVVKAMGED